MQKSLFSSRVYYCNFGELNTMTSKLHQRLFRSHMLYNNEYVSYNTITLYNTISILQYHHLYSIIFYNTNILYHTILVLSTTIYTTLYLAILSHYTIPYRSYNTIIYTTLYLTIPLHYFTPYRSYKTTIYTTTYLTMPPHILYNAKIFQHYRTNVMHYYTVSDSTTIYFSYNILQYHRAIFPKHALYEKNTTILCYTM